MESGLSGFYFSVFAFERERALEKRDNNKRGTYFLWFFSFFCCNLLSALVEAVIECINGYELARIFESSLVS